ncbi:ankyrin repeat domain-containing protein [Myxococcota bacterium]|nr:ankyrin repeat domain-containing protein [Myxococcota bacterium]
MSDGFAALLSAIDQGESQALTALKSHQIHVQALDDYANGELVLRAVRGGNVEIVRWLLKSGLRPASFPQAVLEAIVRDAFKIALLLLRLPMDANALDPNGWSLLHHAAHKGEAKLVTALLEKGAEPNVTTPDGMTPLLIAIFQKKEEAGRLLVEAGVDVETPWRGYTPLMHAAHVGAPVLGRALLERGAGFYVTLPDNGWDALLIATAQNHLSMVELLVAHGADIDVKDNQGYTPLFIAVNSGFKEIALHLVQRRASADEPAHNGMTPLWAAIHHGNAEMVRVLLTVDIDLNARAADGMTPLLYATAMNQVEIVEALLEKGADLSVAAPDGRTALVMAEEKPELLRVFARYSPELSSERFVDRGATGRLPDLSTGIQHEAFEAPPTFIGEAPLSRAEVKRRGFLRFITALLIIGGLAVAGLWVYITYFNAPSAAAEGPIEPVKLAPAVASIGAPLEPEAIADLQAADPAFAALIDGDLDSPWRAEAPKPGAEAPIITLRWAAPRRVQKLRFATGVVEAPSPDKIALKIEDVEIHVEGQAPFTATLEDREDWQAVPLESPAVAAWVEVKPLSFYRPATPAAPPPPKPKPKRKPKPKAVKAPTPPAEEIVLAEIEVWADPVR